MTTKYRCICADPPWNEQGGGKITRGAQKHYALMKTPQIVDVMRTQLADRVADDALMWMWATSNHLRDALDVITLVGFEYVTSLVWVKTGGPGLGQRTRQRHELLLLGRVGRPAIPAPTDRPDSVIEAPRGRHSAKPAEAYARIEKACPGPRLEMFARAARPGWDVWGDEAPIETGGLADSDDAVFETAGLPRYAEWDHVAPTLTAKELRG